MENIIIEENECSIAGVCDILTDSYLWVFVTDGGACAFSITLLRNENHTGSRYPELKNSTIRY